MKNLMYACLSILFLSLAGFLAVTSLQLKRIGDETYLYISETREQQRDLRAEAETASALMGDILTFSLATVLKHEGMLFPTDTQEITTASIQSISSRSETYGKMVRAINNSVNADN